MNNKRRQTLKKAYDLLDTVSDIISGVLDEEQDSLDNMPENLKYSDRCDKMEDIINNLEIISEDISETQNCIISIVEGL